MSLYRLAAPGSPGDPGDLIAPTFVGAFDGWVDAGTAATTAMATLVEDAPVVATFEADQLFDYRARRPTLKIVDGRLDELDWPELTVRRVRAGDHDVVILAGPEPDDRWQGFSAAVVEIARRLNVVGWVSLGSIPAAVPHTRDVPILGTTSAPGQLRGDVQPGPSGTLQVPGAVVSVLEMAMVEAGIPAVGYFAQVPHYVSGPYPAASVALLRALGRHLGEDLPIGDLENEAQRAAHAPERRDLDGGEHALLRRAPRGDGRRGAPAIGRRPHLRDRALPARRWHRGQPAPVACRGT